MSKRILIIEPHADDALLACYVWLEKLPEKSIDILTCCTHEDGRSSDNLVSKFISINKVITLPYSEQNYLWDSKKYTIMQVSRASKQGNLYEDQLKDLHSRSSCEQDLIDIGESIGRVIDNLDYDYIFIPFGLMHPYHLLITEACHYYITDSSKIQIYFEIEHYNKKSVRDRLIPEGFRIWREFLNPNLRSYKEEYNGVLKFNAFKEVYPTEMHLMIGDKPGHIYGETFMISPEFLKFVESINSPVSSYPRVHVSKFENEKYVEEFYQQSEDPWNNKGQYIKWFEGLDKDLGISNTAINLIDLGCGGGNVLEGLINQLQKANNLIKVKGIDISETAIKQLVESHKFDEYNSEFRCATLTDPKLDFTELVETKNNVINIVSIVDVLYYIRSDSKWKSLLLKILEQIPVGSYLIVADSAFSKAYRDYLEKECSQDIRVIKGGSSEPVYRPTKKGEKVKYLKWTIYQKLK